MPAAFSRVLESLFSAGRYELPATTRRRSLLIAALAVLLLPLTSRAQAADLLRERLQEADWQEEVVAEGVQWRRAQLRLFGMPQSLNVLEVDLEAPGVVIDVVSTDTGRAHTSALARSADAVAAVNGSFFDTANGASVVYLQQDGRVIPGSSRELTGERQEAAIATDRDGDALVLQRSAPMRRYHDVLASGPMLIWDGSPAPFAQDGFNVTHHPRTAAGITPDNRLLLVTVDGRAPEAAGMTIQELTWLMDALGASQALNLDGGGSTTMWIRGSGVVNYPSDNDKFDHEGERTVANAVVVRAADAQGVLERADAQEVLKRAHAHNDYEHARPLLDALDHGFRSIEADVHLVGGELLVAHDREDVEPGRTLEALYLDPLRERIRENGGSVYGDGTPLLLLVDVKSDAEATYRALRSVLRTYADILTIYAANETIPGAVEVVISGNRARPAMLKETIRFAAYDGRLEDLEGGAPPRFIPLVSAPWYGLSGWRGEGPIPPDDLAELRRIVRKAHEEGRMLRFWATADTSTVWQILLEEDVDLIGADDLDGLAAFLRGAAEETGG